MTTDGMETGHNLPTDCHLVQTFRDLKGRYTAEVALDGVGGALGHSWTSYENAIHDAIAYLREQSHAR